jgi:CDP-diacylglycerol--serine O-phosphatidyltransferase
VAVLAVVLVFVLISLDPPQVLFLIFFGYGLSGPLGAAFRWTRQRNARRAAESRRL